MNEGGLARVEIRNRSEGRGAVGAALWSLDRRMCRVMTRFAARRPARPREDGPVHFFVSGLGYGGTPRQVALLVPALRDLGTRCKVWTHGAELGASARDLQSADIPVGILRNARGPFAAPGSFSRRFISLTAWTLAARLRHERPAILQSFLDPANAAAALAARLAGVPVAIAGLRSLHPRDWPPTTTAYWGDVYDLPGTRFVDAFIANSAAGAFSFRKHQPEVTPDRVFFVPSAARLRPTIRAATDGATPDPAAILWLGRVEEEKRPDLFVDAFERVRARHATLRARVAGSGTLLPWMRAEITRRGLAGSVTYVGPTNVDEDALFARSTLLVLCSDIEGQPNAALEAAAFGCPVVATSVGGVPEVIRDEINGLLVPPNDSEAIAEAICRVITDGTLRARLSRGGAGPVRTAADLARDTAEVYRTVLGRTPR